MQNITWPLAFGHAHVKKEPERIECNLTNYRLFSIIYSSIYLEMNLLYCRHKDCIVSYFMNGSSFSDQNCENMKIGVELAKLC